VHIVNLEANSIGNYFEIGRGARVVVDFLDSENDWGLQMGKSQLVRFVTGGGSLTIRHGNFSLSCSIPTDGVIVDTTDNAPAALVLSDFIVTRNESCPPVRTPIIRFKVNGAARSAMAQRYFVCEGCRGLNYAQLDLNPTGHDQLAVSMIAIRSKPESPGYTGTDTFNLLQGPSDVYDSFRRDVPGKLNVMGGPRDRKGTPAARPNLQRRLQRWPGRQALLLSNYRSRRAHSEAQDLLNRSSTAPPGFLNPRLYRFNGFRWSGPTATESTGATLPGPSA